MNRDQIDTIAQQHAFPDAKGPVEIVETHANFILLSTHFAFKIKKEVHFSFLDYSTLEKRLHFCQRELELNQRLTHGIYMQVLPICETPAGLEIRKTPGGQVVDYALQMHRMDPERHMPLMLEKGQVKPEHIQQIAQLLAQFHQNTTKIYRKVDWTSILADFSDILSTHDWVEKNIGHREAELLHAMVSGVSRFLQRMEGHLQYRNDQGYTVDGHGDLHSGNIFLLDTPILFDCIEFNDHFRQLDVLDEVAFLFMDLCYHLRPDLAEFLLSDYLDAHPVIEGPPDTALFYYYLCYRANVRFKVNALQAAQSDNKEARFQAQTYWSLLKDYFILFQKRGWF
ncbi:MAG: hypothetical protein IPL49_16380 [Saprospirales bacterium]|nr:hypothetical protein [Saprospirales bacterium]